MIEEVPDAALLPRNRDSPLADLFQDKAPLSQGAKAGITQQVMGFLCLILSCQRCTVWDGATIAVRPICVSGGFPTPSGFQCLLQVGDGGRDEAGHPLAVIVGC